MICVSRLPNIIIINASTRYTDSDRIARTIRGPVAGGGASGA